MQGNGYTIGFAAAITVICSLLLSGVSGALKEKQEENRVVDRQKNILAALGVPSPKKDGEGTLSPSDQLAEMGAKEVQDLFNQRVDAQVIDKSGNVVEGKAPTDLPAKVASGEEYNPELGQALYSLKSESGNDVLAYAYPVTGKGLWSTLYGYLAVKPDGNEIVGLSFYKHGETPGLGANIEQPWFRDNFVGKELYKGGKLVGVKVVKGKAADQAAPADMKENHMVDGMSGATITGNGVTKMMETKPKRYEPFFEKVGSAPAKAADPAPADAPAPGGEPADDGADDGDAAAAEDADIPDGDDEAAADDTQNPPPNGATPPTQTPPAQPAAPAGGTP